MVVTMEEIHFGKNGAAWTQIQLGKSCLSILNRMISRAIPEALPDDGQPQGVKIFENCLDEVQLNYIKARGSGWTLSGNNFTQTKESFLSYGR